MAIKIYFRRFTSLLLCGLLVFCSLPVQVHATDPVTAASLAITGGQLAGAGLSGEAALSLAGPVGAVVGLTLAGLGLNAVVSDAAAQAGKTRTQFVLDKLIIWGAQAGYTKEQLYNKIGNAISVAADGTISLGKDARDCILQFGNWICTQEGLVVPEVGSPGTTEDIYRIGEASITMATQWVFADSSGRQIMIINATNPVACELRNGRTYVYSFVANTYFEYKRAETNFGGHSTGNRIDNSSGTPLYYANGLQIGAFDSSFETITYPSSYSTFMNYWGTTIGDVVLSPPVSVPSDDVFTGTPEGWAENHDVLNPSAEDTPVVLNPDLLNPIIDSLTDGQQATMSIIDYLEALQDAWDHALDDVQTAIGIITDTLTGIQEQIAVPQDAVKNPTVTNPSVTPETTPVLDPSTVDPGTVVTGLSFDLTQIFPFCIPFDIYDMLATLSATPEAPVYHVHYEGPYNILIDFTVDLSPWDSVATVLRTVELLAFCIGLAYVTRSMFIRS